MIKAIFISMLILPLGVLAQSKGAHTGQAVVMVVGKPMTAADSLDVKRMYLSALREGTIGNNDLAGDLYSQILQTDPANDAALYELAQIKKLKNNQPEALALLEKAVTVKPENEWYWLALIGCYEKNNDLPKIEYALNALLKINPDKPEYYMDKANALYLQQKYTEALEVYSQLEEQTGLTDDIAFARQKIYLKQGNINEAAAQLEHLIAGNPANIRYYLLLAEVYNSNNLNDKAVKILLKAQNQDADNPLVHLGLADIYRDQKKYQESYNQLKLAFALPELNIDQEVKIVMGYGPKFPDPNAVNSALELSRMITVAHPTEARGFALYGDILLQSSNFKEARLAFQQSVKLNNKIYAVQEQLVRLDVAANDLDAAIKDGESSLALFPNQAFMNYLVGISYLQKKTYSKAVDGLKKAAALAAQDNTLQGQIWSGLGDSYHETKQDAASDDAYDKSLAYTPDNAYTLNNYAYYLSLRNERLEKAAQMAKHANELQPGTASFEDTYAWILFKQKNYQEAKLWMEKALQHDKGHSATQAEHYGDILFKLGNIDGAVQSWKKARDYGAKSAILERKINEKTYLE